MKIEQEHIDTIRSKFASMQNKEDLLLLLNEAKKIIYGDDCKPVQLKSLTYYANPETSKKRYTHFVIKKKTGGVREINAPVSGLKSILHILNFVLQCITEPHNAATGFVLNKSIVDNAKVHVGRQYVLNLDLKDFFHSFDRTRVKYGFVNSPFNLSGDREPLAFLLASLCTHPLEIDGQLKTVLPQGSPTSPTITNILCVRLDIRLTGLAKRFGAKYSRYADDITFSSQRDIFKDKDFLKELTRIIQEDQQLNINEKKTRLQYACNQQEVTGLIVNEKVNVRQRYLKQIRMWLYYWEKYGYEKAQSIFVRDYKAEKGHIKKGNPNLDNVLDGKLEFLKMVKGVEDSTYVNLRKRFDKLTGRQSKLDEILSVWETEGIEKAMELYYSKI
jgi:retron-type reverse transcriptase